MNRKKKCVYNIVTYKWIKKHQPESGQFQAVNDAVVQASYESGTKPQERHGRWGCRGHLWWQRVIWLGHKIPKTFILPERRQSAIILPEKELHAPFITPPTATHEGLLEPVLWDCTRPIIRKGYWNCLLWDSANCWEDQRWFTWPIIRYWNCNCEMPQSGRGSMMGAMTTLGIEILTTSTTRTSSTRRHCRNHAAFKHQNPETVLFQSTSRSGRPWKL